MALNEEFQKASEEVKNLSQRPSNDQLLELYALYKQGSEGDVSGKRPGLLDIKGRAKYDAWSKKAGMSSEEAMQAYVNYVRDLQQSIG